LIGADPEDFDASLKSYLFGSRYEGIKAAVGMVKRIQELSDAEISEVEESAKIYEDVLKQLEPYKKLLDVYTADFFLKPKKRDELKSYISPLTLLDGMIGNPLDVIIGKIELSEDKKLLIDRALELAEGKRFFHWKLEFPEVWYGTQNGGFDVVIGNPPYVEFKRLDKETKDILSKLYKTAVRKYDLYVPFIERGINLLSTGGYLSFICPQMFYKRDYGIELRKFLVKNCKNIKIIDFGSLQIFEGIINYVAVLDVEKLQGIQDKVIKIAYITSDPAEILNKQQIHFTEYKLPKSYSGEEWMVIPIKLKNTVLLGKIVERISEGIATGKDKVFLIEGSRFDLDGKNDIWKPMLKGKDVQRYFIHKPEVFVFYPYRLINGKNQVILEDELKKVYPKTYKYLQDRKNLLAGREYFEKSRKIWYELWCERDPFIFETSPKIVVQEISNSNKFAVDENRYYFNTKVFGIILPKNSKWNIYALNAILASRLCEYIYKHISSPKESGYFEYKTQFLSKIPIPEIDFTIQSKKELDELKGRYEKERFPEIQTVIKSLPQNSAVLHDFLSYLATEMTELNQNKYLLQLFVDGKLEHGTDEMIQVLKLLEKHPEWRSEISEDLKKEIARNIIRNYESRISQTDNLIDQIVYHMYELNYDDIKIIEGY